MKAIQLIESIPRYLLTKGVGKIYPPAYWGPLAMLQYRDVPDPPLPGSQWVRIKTRYGGICGSDMHTVFLEGSPALSAFVSFPFTLGHENVGVITEVGSAVQGFATGDRVVAEALLPCATRGIEEWCAFCQRGDFSLCQNFTEGHLASGLSIGACRDTGGSWSPGFVAHQSQLFRVPDSVSDENAVMVDAFCSALHPVMRNLPGEADTVLVLGAGSVGLCTVAALRALGSSACLLVVARYPFQGEMARRYGADRVIYSRERDYFQVIAEATGARVIKPLLAKPVLVGGADIVYECVGSESSLDDSLRMTRAGGRVVVVGLASILRRVDWTPVWLNELTVRGSFWCGTETVQDRRVRTVQLALDWMAEGRVDLTAMVTHRFRLDEYRRALAVTANKGRHQVIKSIFVFD